MSKLRDLRVLRGAVLVAVGLAAPLLAQRGAPAPDPIVKENATRKVAAHTYVIPDDNVPLVPNVGIVVGDRATLVIDPGLGRRNGEAVLREVAKVSKNSELYIASTHFHAEHTTGNLAFPASAKYVNSTIQEAEFAEAGPQQIQAFSGRSPATAALLNGAVQRKADVTFDRQYDLDLGGAHVRFMVVGPTHTKGDTGLFVQEDRVLFAGDVVMNNSFVAANASSSMKAWRAAFDIFEAMHPAVIVPSHGAVGTGDLIAANRAVLEEIQSRVRVLKAEGRSADEAASTIQAELLAKHPDWPRSTGIAPLARSAYAE